MTLIRTFHPVGQGAFYTERHCINNKEFTIAYDCGSFPLDKVRLERKIKSTFPKGHSIDILFISHFHADHINGIEVLSKHCNIKKVVLPLIDDEEKILLKLENALIYGFNDDRLIDNPEDFFGNDIPIIKIKEVDIGSEWTNEGRRIDILETDSQILPSGVEFFSTYLSSNWYYIPFNYKYDERSEQFKNALLEKGLALDSIKTIDDINKNKKILFEVYGSLPGGFNNHSMILYSGKKEKGYISFVNYCYFYQFFHLKLQCGCLYMGDINLNQRSIVKDIKNKLREILPFIGTLQIPHHGSIHNFNPSILEDSSIACVIFSFGSNNHYGHPSDRVIGDVVKHNICPYLVTEDQTTIVIQKYKKRDTF